MIVLPASLVNRMKRPFMAVPASLSREFTTRSDIEPAQDFNVSDDRYVPPNKRKKEEENEDEDLNSNFDEDTSELPPPPAQEIDDLSLPPPPIEEEEMDEQGELPPPSSILAVHLPNELNDSDSSLESSAATKIQFYGYRESLISKDPYDEEGDQIDDSIDKILGKKNKKYCVKQMKDKLEKNLQENQKISQQFSNLIRDLTEDEWNNIPEVEDARTEKLSQVSDSVEGLTDMLRLFSRLAIGDPPIYGGDINYNKKTQLLLESVRETNSNPLDWIASTRLEEVSSKGQAQVRLVNNWRLCVK